MTRSTLLILLLSSLFLLTSCGEDDGFTIEPVPTAFIVFVNAIPDSPELSITSRGSLVSRVQFGAATLTLTVLPQVSLEYSADFLSDGNIVNSLITTNENIAIGDTRLVIFSGTMDAPKVTSLTSAAADASTTESQVIFLNASTSANNVNLTLTNPNASTQTINLPVDVVSEAIQVLTGAGSKIEVRDAANNEILWDSGEFNFTAVTQRLIVLVDYFGPGNNTVRMFSITEQAGAGLFVNEQVESQIRFANMTADRGALDVLADGILAADVLNFGDITNYQDTETDVINYRFVTSGDPDDVISTESRAILPGNFYTLAASGIGTTNGTTLILDDRRRVPLRSVLNIARLAPSSGLLDIYLLEPGEGISRFPLVSQLGDSTALTIDLVPSSYDLLLTAPGQSDSLFGPEPITLSPNGIYSLFITDTEGGGGPIRVQFLDDFTN
ncbi:MAG: DUF4397 domain-containing protein [Pseudomonadales bacterium]|nr:DUF4397 domain-containing protein [Pseudomonadales bacterium]